MNTNDKNIGIGMIVLGGAGLFWVFIRMTSLMGKLHSWSPPFDSFETTTIIVGLIALLCLVVGVRNVKGKPTGEVAQPSGVPQGGGIDFRTLSKFIALFGIAVACYGGFRYRQNMPLPEPPPDSGQFKGWGDFLNKTTDPTKNAMGVALLNSDRARARTDAYKVMGVGVAIMFAAFAIERSTRRT